MGEAVGAGLGVGEGSGKGLASSEGLGEDEGVVSGDGVGSGEVVGSGDGEALGVSLRGAGEASACTAAQGTTSDGREMDAATTASLAVRWLRVVIRCPSLPRIVERTGSRETP